MNNTNTNINKNIDNFTSLKQRVSGYKPSLRSLRTQISKEIESPTEDLYYLFIESTAVVLFTTKIGLSILNELYNINLGKYDKLINKYDKKLKPALSYMHSNWSLLTLLKFYRFCLFNDLSFLDIRNYNDPLYKNNLLNQLYNGSNWQNSLTLISLACNTDFNILIDLLRFFTADIEDCLTKMTIHYVTDPKWYITGKIPTSTKYQYLGGFIVTQYDRAHTTCDFFPNIDLNTNSKDFTEKNFLLKNELVELYLKPITKSDFWDVLFISVQLTDTAIEYFHELSKYDENREYLIKLQKASNQQQPIDNNKPHINTNISITNISPVDKNFNSMVDINWHSELRYGILSLMLNLKSFNDFSCTSLQFEMLCTLVDPLTQPLPNDKYIISIDLLANLFLFSCYNDLKSGRVRYQGYETRFHIGLNMERIILNSMERLNCEDYNHLQSLGVDNFDNKNIEHWWNLMYSWLPHGLNTQDLELLYMVNIIAVYVIYKLFNDKPVQLNPFLSTLISVWKKLSCVILFSLDIDRMLEQDTVRETPLLVRATIRGASALRAVIATVLNNYMEYMEHDFKHEPINTFMSPHGRKLCQGALYTDIRSYAAAMLALGVDLKNVTALFSDLQAGDRFDEDIRYMFEYEYEDYNIVEDEPQINDVSITKGINDNIRTNSKNNEDNILENENIGKLFQQRRCDCIFDDDKIHGAQMMTCKNNTVIEKNNTVMTTNNQENATSNNPIAGRSKAFFEFDYSGKDWRDVPRGLNLYYTSTYQFIVNPKLEDVNKLIVKASTTALTYDEAILLLRLVSSCVKEEQESMIFSHLNESSNYNIKQQEGNKAKTVTPEDIYELLCDNSTFGEILYINPELGWRLMDEMLMCNGYRRVLIWFLTHMEINHTLIHYIFELVMGLRGQDFESNTTLEDMKKLLLHDILVNHNHKTESSSVNSGNKDKFPFSRQGPLILSDIETSMLLQEFFTNAAIYLSNKSNLNGNPTQYDVNDNIGVSESSEEGSEYVSLYAIGLVKLICFMVRTLMENGKFDFVKTECSFELQTLLMNWIGLIPEAQELFFMIKSNIADKDITTDHRNNSIIGVDSDFSESKINTDDRSRRYIITSEEIESGDLFKDDDDDSASQASSNSENKHSDREDDDVDEYSKKLLKLLPYTVNKDQDNNKENHAFLTLRSYMKRHSFVQGVPVTGRKVVHRGTKILPMKQNERPISIREYMKNYDYFTQHEW